MPEQTVICNTSPLLYLHQVSRLELLHELYGDVRIPPAVKDELQVGYERGVDVPRATNIDWINVEAPNSASLLPAIVDLRLGEAEVFWRSVSSSKKACSFSMTSSPEESQR